MVFGEALGRDVHAAIVAWRLFAVAFLAIEQAAVKKLLESRSILLFDV